MQRRALVGLVMAACAGDATEVRDVVEVDVPPQLAATSSASAILSVVSASPSSASATVASASLPPFVPPLAGILPPGLLPPSTAAAGALPRSNATSVSPASAPKLGAALRTVAAMNAPGMTQLGAIEAARFKQGDALVVMLQLSPMQCLTAVAVSDTIAELDLEVHVALPQNSGLPPMVLAKDATTGPQAVLGGKPSCFKNPLALPIPMALVARAVRGQGTALVQVFVQP